MRSPLTHFLLALTTLIAVSGAYGAWYTTVSHKSNEVANLQSQIDAANENAGRIALAKTAISEIVMDEERMKNYFVSESSVVSFINELEALGTSGGAAVTVLSVSKGGTSLAPTLLLSLSIQGTFDAVMSTVGAIEYVPYDVSITTLSVEQNGKDIWHANVNIVAGSASVSTATSTKK